MGLLVAFAVTWPCDTNAPKLAGSFVVITVTERRRKRQGETQGRRIFKLLFASMTTEHMFHDRWQLIVNVRGRVDRIYSRIGP